MKNKKCSKCGVVKGVGEFGKNSSNKTDGLNSWCKGCFKEYYQNNKERVAEHKKEYYQNNKERVAEWGKEYYQNNKERVAEREKKYRKNNKKKVAEYQKEYNQNNKEKIAERRKIYRRNNKERIDKQGKEYRKNNKEKMRDYRKKNLVSIDKIKYNISTCDPELKPIVESFIILKNKNKLLKELKDE